MADVGPQEFSLDTAAGRGMTALDKAEAVVIQGDEDYEAAGSFLNFVKAFRAEIMASTGPVVKAAHEGHKAAKKQQNDLLEPIDKAAKVLGDKMGEYQAEMARQQKLEQEAAQAVLDAEVEAERAEFAETIADTDIERAVAITEAPPMVAPKVPNLAPKVKGTQVRENWKFEVVDASQVPRQFLIPDEKAIGALVRAQKEHAKIDGVRTWAETTVK